MRSRSSPAAAGEGADAGVARDVVGIGERLVAAPQSPAQAVLAAAEAWGEKAGRMVSRFIGLPSGSYVWTRQSDGLYRLGRITGPWRYDDSAAARATGIHHVRPTDWLPSRFGDDAVPDAVAQTFARGGRNLQRIRDHRVGPHTVALWTCGRGHRAHG
jgi:hypothetical protein